MICIFLIFPLLPKRDSNPRGSSGRSTLASGTNKNSASPTKNTKEEQRDVKSLNKAAAGPKARNVSDRNK